MESFIVHGGPQVDEYLHRHGAVAQAVYPNSILLSSQLEGTDPAMRRLVLLHELAHLQQFAHPGDDPVWALESVAWQAAHAWAAGRSYAVRGAQEDASTPWPSSSEGKRVTLTRPHGMA